MKIKGKIFGAGTGLLFGGIPGAIIGGIVGHFVDSVSDNRENTELEMLRELTYWAAKIALVNDRFMFSKRVYLEKEIMNTDKITASQKNDLLRSFDRYLQNRSINMISFNRKSLRKRSYEYFKQIYNLASIGGINREKRKHLKQITSKFNLSPKEFSDIDERFVNTWENYNRDVKQSIDLLRLPVFFKLSDVEVQTKMLKHDLAGSVYNSAYTSNYLEEASVILKNYLKEA